MCGTVEHMCDPGGVVRGPMCELAGRRGGEGAHVRTRRPQGDTFDLRARFARAPSSPLACPLLPLKSSGSSGSSSYTL
jgi:hypothetical protein